MSNLEKLLDKAIKIGLIEVEEKHEKEPRFTVRHPDGERITFDRGEADLEAYLEGLLKAWDLIRCGIVETEELFGDGVR